MVRVCLSVGVFVARRRKWEKTGNGRNRDFL